jgi:predicted DNA-binding transcriptional regulator AlpA
MSTFTPPTNQTWLRDSDLAARFGVSRSTIWRWARQGRLPPPHRLGPRTTRWPPEVLSRFPDDTA